MPPKPADKKPASKAPATASKAPEKKDAGKKTAASGDKKKRTKARKETYSSYIYKGELPYTLFLLSSSAKDGIALRNAICDVSRPSCSWENGPFRACSVLS